MDNKINIYDVSAYGTNRSLRQSIRCAEPGIGFTKVKFSERIEMLTSFFAASTAGNVHVMDVRNGSTLQIYRGHFGPINDFVEVIRGGLHVLATAGDDGTCSICDLDSESKSWTNEIKRKEKRKGLKVMFE